MGLAGEVLGHGRPRLVLVHGFTQTGRCWDAVAADLAADHEVVLVDAPGHGDSAGIAAGLDEGAALLGETGATAVYVGYSMGGRLCLHLALARPDLVRGLVLVGATPGIDDPAERAARRAADEQLAADLERDGLEVFLERWLAQPLFASLPRSAAALPQRRRNTVAGLASSLRLAGTGVQRPLRGELDRLTMPVLLVVGEHDEKFRRIGEEMTAAIAGAELAVVARAGHAAHLEQPGAVVALVRRWLAAKLPEEDQPPIHRPAAKASP